MPYPNEHAARMKNPSRFIDGTFRRKKSLPVFRSLWPKTNPPAKPKHRRIDSTANNSPHNKRVHGYANTMSNQYVLNRQPEVNHEQKTTQIDGTRGRTVFANRTIREKNCPEMGHRIHRFKHIENDHR